MVKWASVFSALILVVSFATAELLRWRADKCREGNVQGGVALTCPGKTSRQLFSSSHGAEKPMEDMPLTTAGRSVPRPGFQTPYPSARMPDMRPRLIYRLSGTTTP